MYGVITTMNTGLVQLPTSATAAPLRRRTPVRPLIAAATVFASLLAVGPAPVSANAQGCGGTGSSGPTVRVGNAVFVDTNDDGVFDATESGVDGVTVELWLDVDDDGVFEPGADDGAVVCTTTTSGGGNYWFHDVDPDQYFVAIPTAPAGHVSSTGVNNTAGTDNVDDGAPLGSYAAVSASVDLVGALPTGETAPDGTTDDEAAAEAATAPDTFLDAESDLTIDFGFAPISCLGIGNRVWLDADNDGAFDAGEVGIDGVTAQLFAADGAGAPTGSVLETVVTSDGGYYLFGCHGPGDYVVVVAASNFAAGGPLTGMRSTVNGTAGTDQQDDGLDPAAPGDRVISRVATLADGAQPTAEVDKPAGTAWSFDAPADNAIDTTIDFGFVGLSLGNRIWNDTANPNGVHDGGEPGIAGVTVQLWTSDGTNPTGASPLATATTDANGFYRFSNLTPGAYVVRIPASNFAAAAVLSGWTSTAGNGVAPDPDTNQTDRDDNGDPNGTNVDSEPVTLAVGSEPTGETDIVGAADAEPSDNSANMTVDFGFVDPTPASPTVASLGDVVWIDADRDGIQDAGEEPVSGVTMTLYDSNGNQIASDTTDVDGRYDFTGLNPGTYEVCVLPSTLPAGMVPTARDAGGDDALDSDFGSDNCTDPVVLAAGTDNPTLDLGLVPSNVDLSVTKSGVWSQTRSEVAWSVVIRNVGTEADPGPIVLTDILPTGLGTPVISAPTGMSCDYNTATRQITCTSAASLPAGASIAVGITTARTVTSLCDVSNTATVRGAAVDATSANNVATARVTGLCTAGNGATNNAPTNGLPRTGGTLLLVTMAGMLAVGGYQLLRLADRRSA